MKKKVIALLLSIVLAAGNPVTVSVLAAETVSSEERPESCSASTADTIYTAQTEEQTVRPKADGKSAAELFSVYVDKAFSRPVVLQRVTTLSTSGSALDGIDQILYKTLADQLPAVASGERASTVFEIPVEDLGLEQLSWTAEELGVDDIFIIDDEGNGSISDEAVNAVQEKTAFDLYSVIASLIADFPYHLYWYDKTQETSLSGFMLETSYDHDADEFRLGISGSITISMPVSPDFSAGDYLVDTSIGQAVQTSVQNAQAVISENQDLSDFEKLCAYRDAICSRVSYNTEAAGGNVSYGNPWQMIWVFDDDPSTNVVCEGYSKAFKYLCDQTDFNGSIHCLTVSGIMSGGTGEGNHMWNLVGMEDGNHYLVDITNCDEDTAGYPDLLFMTGAEKTDTYQYSCSCNGQEIIYEYDENTIRLYTDDELAVSSVNFDPDSYTEHIHSWNTDYTVDREATCTEEGSESIHCSVCGAIDESSVRAIPVKEHTYGDWTVTKKAGCTENGSREKICQDCGSRVTETIPAGHRWDTFYTTDKEAGFTEEGSESIHCSVCGAIDESSVRPIEKLKKSISGLTVSDIAAVTYNGKAQTPDVIVKDGSSALAEGTDYTVEYDNNTDAGTASVLIEGCGSYTGSLSASFTINKAANKITAKNIVRTYSSKAQSFALGAKASGGTVTYKSDNKAVTVSRAGRVKVSAKYIGKAVITITAQDRNYKKAVKKISITVNPTKTALSSVSSPSSGKLKVKWQKNSSGSGYQIQYSTSSKFTGAKSVWTTSNKTVSKTVSKLKKGKKYYVRIRTYKKVGSAKFYSGWSKSKSAVIK